MGSTKYQEKPKPALQTAAGIVGKMTLRCFIAAVVVSVICACNYPLADYQATYVLTKVKYVTGGMGDYDKALVAQGYVGSPHGHHAFNTGNSTFKDDFVEYSLWRFPRAFYCPILVLSMFPTLPLRTAAGTVLAGLAIFSSTFEFMWTAKKMNYIDQANVDFDSALRALLGTAMATIACFGYGYKDLKPRSSRRCARGCTFSVLCGFVVVGLMGVFTIFTAFFVLPKAATDATFRTFVSTVYPPVSAFILASVAKQVGIVLDKLPDHTGFATSVYMLLLPCMIGRLFIATGVGTAAIPDHAGRSFSGIFLRAVATDALRHILNIPAVNRVTGMLFKTLCCCRKLGSIATRDHDIVAPSAPQATETQDADVQEVSNPKPTLKRHSSMRARKADDVAIHVEVYLMDFMINVYTIMVSSFSYLIMDCYSLQAPLEDALPNMLALMCLQLSSLFFFAIIYITAVSSGRLGKNYAKVDWVAASEYQFQKDGFGFFTVSEVFFMGGMWYFTLVAPLLWTTVVLLTAKST